MEKSGQKSKRRDPIPEKFSSIEEAAEFWDTHSLADYEDLTEEVEAEIRLVRNHFRVDRELARRISQIARRRGISSETLVNLWLQEKVS
jgi:hypothetical protein